MKSKHLHILALMLLPALALRPAIAFAQGGPSFSDTNWLSLGGIRSSTGSPGIVNAAVADGAGNLYVGGFFTRAGSTLATNIAKWNGTTWSALGPGLGSDVYGGVSALALSGTNLYAGGTFTNMGGVAVGKIAKWDGISWSSLGAGIDPPPSGFGIVFALAVSGNTLYAGGSFHTAGGVSADYVAQWDGSFWSALNSESWNCYSVYSLAAAGSDLYAGGGFSMAGGVAATNIAHWNGSTWSALGSGLSGGPYPLVYAIAVSGTNLYAGGQFNTAGGVAASSVARWNGATWSALGSGVSGAGDGFGPVVQALAVSGVTVYAGGDFNFAGGTPADYIARWDGSSWSALGSGMNHSVIALAPSGTNLYVSGNFTTAGTAASVSIAEAVIPKLPATVILSNLAQAYDGSAKSVTVTTIPPGVATSVTYNGLAGAPTNVGSYTVVATIDDPTQEGGATNTLVIGLQLTAPGWDGHGEFQFSFNTASGVNYTIQLSSDFKNWAPALTLHGSGGRLTVLDPNASSAGPRYYRVKIGP